MNNLIKLSKRLDFCICKVLDLISGCNFLLFNLTLTLRLRGLAFKSIFSDYRF